MSDDSRRDEIADELAVWLCALEDAEMYKPIPESLVKHARLYLFAGKTEKHSGDCTNECHSCVVCGTESYLLHARQIAAALRSAPALAEVRDATIEIGARAIAKAEGHDPDDLAPRSRMCTADNEQVSWWLVFEEQAEACLRAALSQPQKGT